MWAFLAGCLGLLVLALLFVLHPWWRAQRPRTESMRDILANAYDLRRDRLAFG